MQCSELADMVCRDAVAQTSEGSGAGEAWRAPVRAAAPPTAEKPPPPTVPKHLATPTLMQRAGNSAVYDEPEVDRVTPRGDPPQPISLCFNHPEDTPAATTDPSSAPLVPPADKATPRHTAVEVEPSVVARTKPQLPQHLRGAFSPRRGPPAAQPDQLPAAAGAQAMTGSHAPAAAAAAATGVAATRQVDTPLLLTSSMLLRSTTCPNFHFKEATNLSQPSCSALLNK